MNELDHLQTLRGSFSEASRSFELAQSFFVLALPLPKQTLRCTLCTAALPNWLQSWIGTYEVGVDVLDDKPSMTSKICLLALLPL